MNREQKEQQQKEDEEDEEEREKKEQDEKEQEQEENNKENETIKILSIFLTDKKLGLSYYDELTNKIITNGYEISLNDIEGILSSIKYSYLPSLILIHPRILVNQQLLDIITSDWDGTPEVYSYQTIKNIYWNYDHSINIMFTKLIIKEDNYKVSSSSLLSSLSQLNFTRKTIESLSYQENYLRLSSYFDLSNQQLIQSLGGLMYYLREFVFNLDKIISINCVESFLLDSYLQIDKVSYQSLQIFSEDRHPNVLKGNGKSKEGFSVCSLLDRTKSLPGRRRLTDWLRRPFFNRRKILERQDGVALATRSDNIDFISNLNNYLHKIYDIPKLILRIKKVNATYLEWYHLYITIEVAIPILDSCDIFVQEDFRHTSDRNFIHQLLNNCNTQVVRNLYHILSQSIDFDQSRSEGILTIRNNYNYELDRLRYIYDHLDDSLVNTAKKILENCPLLNTVSVEYLPQIGYLIVIEEQDQHFLDENSNSYQFIYRNGSKLFYKSQDVYELDDTIGDIHSTILDTQKSLIRQIEDELLDYEPHLLRLSVILESLDAILSLGSIAIERNFTRPEIVEDSIIIIKNGRHPLQELVVDTFIPNDTFLSKEKNIGIITGCNGSGKSIYLKQVGLLVFLAHVGCWIPCERAIIGLTDKIFTRITSIETVSNPLSAFALDLTQISRMISQCTNKSLCLIDEFGKGTVPHDGMALVASVIQHYIKFSSRILIIIHFFEILHPEIINLETTPNIVVFKMDVHSKSKNQSGNYNDNFVNYKSNNIYEENDDGDYDDSNIQIPLYKLRIGISNDLISGGISCAILSGVPGYITDRAKEILSIIQTNPNHPKKIESILKYNKQLNEIIKHKKLIVLFLKVIKWESSSESDIQNIRQLLSL